LRAERQKLEKCQNENLKHTEYSTVEEYRFTVLRT
jgi:hypothetical protein